MMDKQIRKSSALEGREGRGFTIPRTEQFVMHSREGGREYRIFVAEPAADPPSTGFPVVYVLDANAVFGTMVEAMRVQSRRPEKTGVYPAIVVGIGYSTDAPFSPSRFCDFTLPVPVSELPARRDGAAWTEVGGADPFLAFIEDELKPEIACRYRIDHRRQMIFGHSLGGLFVLHVLFTRPHAFQTYVAGSPSIHWGKQIILEEERRFRSRPDSDHEHVRLLLSAGELEKEHPSRMNDNARELFERLRPLTGNGLRVEFHEFPGEGHVSVLPALISRSLRFAGNHAPA